MWIDPTCMSEGWTSSILPSTVFVSFDSAMALVYLRRRISILLAAKEDHAAFVTLTREKVWPTVSERFLSKCTEGKGRVRLSEYMLHGRVGIP